MPDEARRNPTLSAQQEQALAVLLGGATVTAAAELRTAAMARLEAVVPTALDTLAELLDHADWRARVAATDRILRALYRPRPNLEPGETTAENVRVAREREERQAQNLAELLDGLTV